jgi:hypothetical protein
MRGLLQCNRMAVDWICKMPKNTLTSTAAGLAALGICESLLLALTDLKMINEQTSRDILTDVATANAEAATLAAAPNDHLAVVAIIEKILAGKNGMPH